MKWIFHLPFWIACNGFAADNPIVTSLQQKGFSCSTQTNGYVCTVNSVHSGGLNYSQPVAIVIPKSVTRPGETQLYLHGFKGVCESSGTGPLGMVNEFNFVNQIKDSNSIMVFPMSSGQCTTYNNELVPQFAKFRNWADAQLGESDQHWIVGGHSGAGSPIAAILAHNPDFTKKVDSTILLDAAYGMGGHVEQWQAAARANPNMNITSVYLPGSSTNAGSHLLKSSLRNSVAIGAAGASEHCKIPAVDYGRFLTHDLALHDNLQVASNETSAPDASLPTLATQPRTPTAALPQPAAVARRVDPIVPIHVVTVPAPVRPIADTRTFQTTALPNIFQTQDVTQVGR